MPLKKYRKRRVQLGPSKNELRSARHERASAEEASAGTLRERFPTVSRLQLNIRMESPTGNPLGEQTSTIALDQSQKFQFPCPSACGNGQFLLVNSLDDALNLTKDTFEGLEICQAASYMDPRAICGTKLYYRFTIEYNT